jgi:diacylglycerol kinase
MLAQSFKFALRGFAYACKTERSLRILILCILLAVAAGIFLGLTGPEWCVVLICCGATLAAELLNTAVECIIDMFVHEYNALAGRAKDVAASATLIFIVISLAVGLIVYVPHILELLG